jgi:HSP20 family protein
MERMFGDFFGRALGPFWDGRGTLSTSFGLSVPAVDLYEEKGEVVAKAELPGIARDDIEVNIEDHQLTIKGVKRKEEQVKEENYYHSERSYGSFIRILDLPGEVQAEKARASFKDGVLEIHLPMTEEGRKKEIQVKVE